MSNLYTEHQAQVEHSSRNWFRFSLKSLLLATALLAAYLGGRASMKPTWFAPQTGTWQMNMPSGHQRAVILTSLADGNFFLTSGGVFTGEYRWKAGQLAMAKPDDKRYMGLIWKWDNNELVLAAEPPSHPSGSAYLGTRLRFVSPDMSSTTQQSVSVRPSNAQIANEMKAALRKDGVRSATTRQHKVKIEAD